MKACTDCSCCGFYVGYDPRVQGGGVAVPCKTCKGRGWLNDDGTELPEPTRSPYANTWRSDHA